MLFVNGCRIWMGSIVSDEEIEKAFLLFQLFTLRIPSLYGAEHVSYNVHILQHIAEFSKYWGAPWAYSTFIYEDTAGHLKNHNHGTKGIDNQVFSGFIQRKTFRKYASQHIPLATVEEISFDEQLDGPIGCVLQQKSHSMTIGSSKRIMLKPSHLIVIEQLIDRAT